MRDLQGRVAAITGTASGIGKATAVLLAREGCSLAISDINEEGLRETEREINALGAKVHATVLDVADREAVYAWADEVAREFGGVNLIINNAGVALSALIEDMDYQDFEWLININLLGMVHGTMAFLPYLKQADEGHVVNLSSVYGFFVVPTQSAYTTAKFAIRGFTESLRLELDTFDGKVSATVVHPGGIKTNIAAAARMSSKTLEKLQTNRDELAGSFEKSARITPEKAAERIIEGIKRNKHRVLIGPEAYIMDILQRLAPTGYLKVEAALYRSIDRLIRLRQKK